ncbi:monovalent cation/H(+) antiporter subunit G [Xylanimonas sp. McL0601]|uniref:monovalent cation/H(+) antiporter subunit G n=1 Tax=Xylanimonas sp. McL0601 TaxID=3414739 RepID=UPI003CEE56CC
MANEIIGNVIIGIGTAAVVLGLVGVFRFKEFNLKLLASSKIDTVGLIAIVLGAAVRSGVTWFSAKALLILAVVVLVSPIVTSTIAAGARQAERSDAGEG